MILSLLLAACSSFGLTNQTSPTLAMEDGDAADVDTGVVADDSTAIMHLTIPNV